MGYPMTYWRVLWRNDLIGDYNRVDPEFGERGMIRGDLRRLELDQRDEHHLKTYAAHAGITPAQAKAVLDLFFDGYEWDIAARRTVEQQRGVSSGSQQGTAR